MTIGNSVCWQNKSCLHNGPGVVKKQLNTNKMTLSLNMTSQKWSDTTAHSNTDADENYPKTTLVTHCISPRPKSNNTLPAG